MNKSKKGKGKLKTSKCDNFKISWHRKEELPISHLPIRLCRLTKFHLFHTIYFQLQCNLLLSLFLFTICFGCTRPSSGVSNSLNCCTVWYVQLLISHENAISLNLKINGHTTQCNNFSKLETPDDGHVQPKHVVRRKRNNKKLHCRWKYIVWNKWYINATGYLNIILWNFTESESGNVNCRANLTCNGSRTVWKIHLPTHTASYLGFSLICDPLVAMH
jgi:hypothetical protein